MTTFHKIAEVEAGVYKAQAYAEVGGTEPPRFDSTNFTVRLLLTPGVDIGKDIESGILADVEPLELVLRTPIVSEWILESEGEEYYWFQENLPNILRNLVRRLHETDTGEYFTRPRRD